MTNSFSTRRVVGLGGLPALALGLSAGVIAIDQASKAWARTALDTPIDLAPFIALRLGLNPGITFGLFAGSGEVGRWLLSGVTILVAAVLAAWIWRTRSRVNRIAAALLLGGAVGNLVDRLRFGAVTDFIDVHWRDAHWPTFNLADTAIVCGVGLLLLTLGGKNSQTRLSSDVPWSDPR